MSDDGEGVGDAAFVRDARKRWSALLDKQDEWDAQTMALAVSLWATLNVDRLLDIAERKA
jgi:hypothetical protein